MAIGIEEKQKTLYAALVRYSSDTRSLRERAVDYLVLIALQETDKERCLTISELRKRIGRGVGTDGMRVEVIQDSLQRLIEKELAAHVTIRHKPAYHVTPSGVSELGGLSKTSQEIIDPCIERMLENYEFNGNKESVKRASKRFIINCFVEYGHTMARCVTGEVNHKELSSLINAKKTFDISVVDLNISEEEKNNLLSRCQAFLKSHDRRDTEVKLILTQAYYLAKILELDSGDFDPLAESSFKDAVIYLDSNVVFESVFDVDNKNLFADLVGVAGRIGISLCVTKVTIEEINRVLTNKAKTLDQIINNLPKEIYSNTKDHVVNGFISALEKNPGLTAEEFINSLRDIREKLESLGIVYIDSDIVNDFDAKIMNDTARLVSDVALKTRGYKKSENVALHDAAHLFLVKKNRSSGIKSWFLTKDGTLSDVSKVIAGKVPLVFTLSSFLQSISPFVQGQQEGTLFNLFESVLEDGASTRGIGNLFEMSELKIISEYHKDIMATDSDQLNLAFDFVKGSLLNGSEITVENQHKVSLEIKKFLQSSADEQKIALQNEIDRKANEVRVIESALLEEEMARIKAVAERDSFEDRLGETEEKLGLAEERLAAERKKKIFIFVPVLLFGIAVSIPLWLYNEKITKIINVAGLSDGDLGIDIGSLLRVFGSSFFILLSLPFCLWFEKKIRIPLLTFCFMVSLYFSKLLSEPLLSGLVNYWSVSFLCAVFASWLVFRD